MPHRHIAEPALKSVALSGLATPGLLPLDLA